jgi:hypothetical protein
MSARELAHIIDGLRMEQVRTASDRRYLVTELARSIKGTEEARAYARLLKWWVRSLVTVADAALKRLGGGNSEVLRDLIQHIRTSPSLDISQ